jgi:hypothetical protein
MEVQGVIGDGHHVFRSGGFLGRQAGPAIAFAQD